MTMNIVDLLSKVQLRKSTMGTLRSAKVSARMVAYRSRNDHDNFERFIIGNRIPFLY